MAQKELDLASIFQLITHPLLLTSSLGLYEWLIQR
jgi:hypothetical protein